MRKILFIIAVILLGLTAANLLMTQNKPDTTQTPEADAGTGTALIGGDFSLTDQDGKTVTNKDFQGRVMLVYFGFTHCPDICPISTQTLAKTLTLLGDKAKDVAAIFITVDPKRDTPDVLKTYLGNVDSRIIGLTGTPEQTEQAANAYKAYFSAPDTLDQQATSDSEADDEAPADAMHDHEHGHADMDHGDMAHDDDYVVDHSGFIYVMGKNGAYVQHFPYDATAESIAAAITPLLN